MPNPYGITQVDVPGIIASYRQGRQDRINAMLENTKLQQMETSLNHTKAILDISRQLAGNMGAGARAAVSAYGGPQGGAQDAAAPDPVGSAPPVAPVGMAGAYGAPSTAPTPDVSGPLGSVAATLNVLPSDAPRPALTAPVAPARPVRDPSLSAMPADPPSRLTDNAGLLSQLAVLDPAHATALTDAFSKMDKAGVDAAHSRTQAIGLAADQLLSVPAERRPQLLHEMAPDLVRMGVPADVLESAGLTDDHLRFYVQQSRDIEKVIEAHRLDRNTDSEIQYRNDEIGVRRDANAINERNNIRTTSTSSANNVRSTGTSAANNERSTNASLTNRNATPAAVGVDANGEQVITYPNNRTVIVHGARPVSSLRGRGRMGSPAAPQYHEGDTAVGAGGHMIVMHAGQWHDKQTGRPIG